MIDRELFILPLLLLFLSFHCMCERHGSLSQTLHLYKTDAKHDKRHVAVFDAAQSDLDAGSNDDFIRSRSKRDASPINPNGNITTRVNHLNDSHQQLMVHWVGESSSVIICLARDPNQPSSGPGTPSALYISYDYGDTFQNKTGDFRLGDKPTDGYAQLDKFYNHPHITSFCIFTDVKNKILFQTIDDGKTIRRTNLTFSPSEISYDEEDPYTFVVLDKVDTMRKLYLTSDGGLTFKPIEEYVKSFYWSSGPDNPLQFYVERAKPYGTNAVLMAPRPDNYTFKEIIDDVQDFQIKGDFMFATKKVGLNNLDLYISYQRRPFVKAEFQTELDLKEFHISDVTGTRIFVSVSHADTLANLYVSEINKDFTEFNFVLSLESILCYFPNSTWNKSWLTNVAEESFADLYKVEGLRGIYIASKVVTKPSGVNIGPEHLMSYISFDHGNNWGPIKPPKQDDEGQPINCALVDDCSLHLSQKFSQLYPVTRSATIMSSKSAPGIIMATGVVGKSLKGHPGMFISRDAGLTWKQILKDYYFFNYGDHGGALVAVRYFKTRGETRELLYSTDEGEKWLAYDFHESDLKVYGLMTEPGENTTVFTMFGSAKGHHQWVIIKVDLFKAFSYNCTIDDYKFWSPSSTEVGSKVPCILGVTDTYQRRIPHANCYNGENYDRPVKKEVCQCDRQDFECDFGFVATAHPSHCIRNKTIVKFDPYAVPGHCKSGEFYNRTKGYRKIDGDMCIDGFSYNYLPDIIPCPMNETTEFLIFAQRGRIARINLGDNKLDVFPIKGLKNVIAIEFDIRNNCLYWADIVSDVIGRQCLSNGNYHPDIIVKTDIASIEGMSLDWISNVLFFVDGMRAKIEAVRTDLSSEGRMRRTILGPSVLTKPRGIAVHPTAGYLFWTDWASNSPSVSRSNLDGTDVKRLFTKPVVEWPNGITIDHIAERIYWVDAMDDYIASSDLNGQLFKKILANEERVSHPFAVAVFKDTMFWDDWKAKAIFSADKDHGVLINTIHDQLSDLMDLKVFSHSLQVGTNACAAKENTCHALCLGMPRGNFSCLCPDGLTMKDDKCMCPGGKQPFSNMTCPKEYNSCSSGQFSCSNGICIPSNWQCDGDNDCGDNSDEQQCTTVTCQPQMILCDTNKCIPHYYKCDHDKDCLDGSDEVGCVYQNCTSTEFKCNNGKCISNKWRCDGEDDCRDGSDEHDCKESHRPTCKAVEFRCPTNGQCIPKSWTCDGEHDCPDAADELKSLCKDAKCMDWMFKCPGNGKCLYTSWLCDGEDDCEDGLASDEQNCTNTTGLMPSPTFNFPATNQCHNWMYLCNNSRCIPYWWKCDGVNDCGDNSDELGCGNVTFVIPSDDKKPNSGNGIDLPSTCKKNHYMCANGDCIPAAWVCDGAADCEGGEDELTCEGGPTGHCKEFRCRQDGACITLRAVCDGKVDCVDGSDELGCQSLKNKTAEKNSNSNSGKCVSNEFACDHGKCISMSLRCNKVQDCYDGTDEINCSKTDTEANSCQVNSLYVDHSVINASSITLYWRVTSTNGRLQYLPSITETSGPKSNVWKNATAWIEEQVYMFTNLKSYTEYNMTVYVRMMKSSEKDGYPPNKYLAVRTGEGMPSSPMRVVARQLAGRRVQVQWDAPVQPNGRIRQYQVLVSPPLPPASISVPASDTQALLQMGHFRPGNNYTFWVVAKNYVYQSNSEAVTLMFDAMGDIDELQHLSVVRLSPTSFQLSWDQIRGVDGFVVKQRLPLPFPEPEAIKTKETNLTLLNLTPGVTYTIEVQAYKDEIMGRPSTVSMSTLDKQLPSVEGVEAVLVNNTSVHLSWRKPQEKLANIQYAVHYGLTMEQLFKVSNLITSNTSMLIENLQACDSYLFTVGLVKPALGPLTKDPVSIITEYNRRAPVRNLRVARNDKDPSTMVITWDSSCNTVSEISVYVITVSDLALNKTTTVKLKPTKNATLTHIFNNMQYGGKYNVTVHLDVPGAALTSAIIYGPALPPPHQVQWRQEPNGSFLLDWTTRSLPSTLSAGKIPQYHYEVIVTEGDNDTSVEHIFPAGTPPFTVPGLKPGESYTLKVRMVTNSGYVGPQSETRSLVVPQDMWIKTEQSSMSLLVGIPLGIIAFGACAALAVLAFKHRRLSTSFARFANPRYDSRSGAATLGNTSDIMDEDEAPPIRGFADDEPLVIA